MTEKSEVVRARISRAAKARFETVAAENGLSPSDFLRLMIDQVTEGVVVSDNISEAAPVKRQDKVTVRLPSDVAGHLADDAKEQRVTASTWAASILMAKFRGAPLPVKSQRRAIQRSFRQLQGMATNTNQMAALMNRGVFTGDSYTPTRDELAALRKGISDLRTDLRQFAAGQYDLQVVGGLDDE
ncbi:type II toxin-antitoxin system RelB/DinJ family antitoxin [Pseudaestuariivita rosea]|uniref:type II toxin-antitoxin system RelB/DinJ family antitoxin n=1 Tax=Pseudaestuariivita rosea TaxID=2763263 RepID=UPI001ABB405E|nr:type II toxin-antitoxin system RelB/DinJ family antitoxin [Pseudaestuariivita rosea]